MDRACYYPFGGECFALQATPRPAGCPPVGFARALDAELTVLSGDAGAKAVLAHLEQLRVIDCNDAGILCDIDQPEDLQLMTNINKPL